MFAKRGYDETTLDEIAEAAGVAKGTLYYHFKNKEALYGFVLSEGLRDLTIAIEQAVAREGLSAQGRLEAVHDALFSFLGSNRDFCLVLLAAASTHLTRSVEALSHLADFFAFFEKTLAGLQEQGAIASDLDIATVASATFGMIGMVVLRKHYRAETVDAEPTRTTLLHMAHKALG